MTIAELIAALSAYPPEIKVIVRGYESGYNHVRKLETFNVAPVSNAAWYDGELDKIWDEDAPPAPVDFLALHLSWGERD